ncbi:MAG: transaldolase family protein [Acidobacteria bacterium]|nr:transaldolase family protein [Acidobacteriota bacterium]
MTQTTPTCLWNDSADLDELQFAIEHGAVGATCNPVIAHAILKAHIAQWRPRIAGVMRELPTATEDEIGWRVVEQLSVDAAALLTPAFATHKGRNGRLSLQTDPRLYRDSAAILRQAERFAGLAPNILVKIPATRAGIAAIEEATAEGISINATVSFTLPQCMAVAQAVERGLERREAAGLDVATMGPVCTLMVGRLDDWLKVVMEREGISTDPGHLEWAGVAVFKKTYRLFRERGYRTRLLSAAFRNHMQWSEFIGGDVVISPPSAWQKRFVASDIEVVPRIDTPVSTHIVDDLHHRFADFRRAYDENGLTVDEFDSYPPARRTLRQFLGACHDLSQLVRDVMLPNPDKPD